MEFKIKLNFHEVVEMWTNKSKDEICYNCSFSFKNGLCPCRIDHINRHCENYWETGKFEF